MKRSGRKRKGNLFCSLGSLLLAAVLFVLMPQTLDTDGGMRGNPIVSPSSPQSAAQESISQEPDEPDITSQVPSEQEPPLQDSGIPADSLQNQLEAHVLDVHVLDVGQGLAVLIQSGDTSLLYDGGNGGASSFVVSYLQRQGIERLDYVAVSHYDADHLSGVVGALHVFEVGTLLAPDYQTDTKIYQSFLNVVSEKELAITSPKVGQSFPLSSASFQVLAPASSSYSDENDYSLVLQVTIGDSSLLLTGDAASASEGEMLDGDISLESDVLVAGHHGSSNSTSNEFLEAVSPRYAIVSCGQNNDYGHPGERVMALLEENQISLYRTDLQGTLRFTMTDSEITFAAAPCEDYASGRELAERIVHSDLSVYTYILNTNSRRFHLPDCGSVADMSPKNRQGTDRTREELIEDGYTPCGSCKP